MRARQGWQPFCDIYGKKYTIVTQPLICSEALQWKASHVAVLKIPTNYGELSKISYNVHICTYMKSLITHQT